MKKYEETVNEMYSVTEREAFSYGFRLGVRLMTEVSMLGLCEDE